jgi:FdhD protein
MKMVDASLHAGGAQRRAVQGVRRGARFAKDDWIAEERPIALEFNGIGHAVMLATPLDLEDFALGFALGEGIVAAASDVHDIDIHEAPEGLTVGLQVAARCMDGLKARRRAMAGRTGCGLCGVETLKQVERPLPALPPSAAIDRRAVARAMTELQALQVLQQATGSVHAAAWCTADGELRLLREDVGRHNALDKLVGALATAGIDATRGFIAVTSRASFEMVHKTAAARVPLLAAVSAATTMAIDLAAQLHLGLVGFARQGDLVIYAGAARLRLDEGADGR